MCIEDGKSIKRQNKKSKRLYLKIFLVIHRGYSRDVGELAIAPAINCLHHRLEVALHDIHADRNRVLQREVLAVLCQNRREIPRERKVFADEHSIANGYGEPERFVMGIPEAQREPGTVHALVEFHDPEHLHAVTRQRVLVTNYRDVAESHSFNETVHHVDVWYRFVRCRSQWCWYQGQLITSQLTAICNEHRLTHLSNPLSFVGFNSCKELRRNYCREVYWPRSLCQGSQKKAPRGSSGAD